MFYLTMHSTHFIYGYMASGNIKDSLLLIRNCSVSDRGTEEVGTCARDRRALQQLALNVHIKHSYLFTNEKK